VAGHRETLFVVDEAYLDFSDEKSALTLGADNLLVLRSLTKAHALAGLRLGFAIGARGRIEALRRVRPPWSVNALAQAAGVAALADTGHLIGSLHALARAKRQLVEDLAVAGFAPLDSATSFFLLEVGDAANVREALLRRRLLVRDCASFGLPTYIRISTRQPEHNARLLAALHEVA
jgi:threonine-phosphate decarboxylase